MNLNSPVEPLPSGTRLNGFLVTGLFKGHNASTLVYTAQDQEGRRFAIKEYAAARGGLETANGDSGDVRQGLRTFATDAHLLSSLNASTRVPGLIAMRDLFKANGTVYAVMDLVEGTPLSELLARAEPIAPAQVQRWAYELASALKAAHEVGLVHGAMHPTDIVIGPGSGATLVGFCSRPAPHLARLTAELNPYAAPEQRAHDLPPTTRSDVYALGAVLYHCITGAPPAAAPERLSGRATGFNQALLEAIDAALTADPDQRPQSAADWVALLPEPATPPLRIVDPAVEDAPVPQQPVLPPPGAPDAQAASRAARRGRGPRIWGAAALLLMLAAVALALFVGDRSFAPFDAEAADRTLAQSRTTLNALEHETAQIAVDGVPAAQVQPARQAVAQARQAFAEQVRASRAIASTEGEVQERWVEAFETASARLKSVELAALKRLIVAYHADGERRLAGVIEPVPQARMALAQLPESSGGELGSRIDVVLRLLTQSQAKLRSIAAEQEGVGDTARAHELLREAKLAYHANSEAYAHLSGLLRDADRAVEVERSERETLAETMRELESAIARSRRTARQVAALAGSTGRSTRPELAPLAEAARQRAASLDAVQEVAEGEGLPTVRTALTEARLAEAELTALLANARRLAQEPRRSAGEPRAEIAAADPPRVRERVSRDDRAETASAPRSTRLLRRQTARDYDEIADRYRDLRRELTRAYRRRGADPARNAGLYAEADRLYAALLNLRELKRLVDGAPTSEQAQTAYREFADSHGRLNDDMRSLRRQIAQR